MAPTVRPINNEPSIEEMRAQLKAKREPSVEEMRAQLRGGKPKEVYPAPVSALVGAGRGFYSEFTDEAAGAAAAASKIFNPFDKVESAGSGDVGAVADEVVGAYREGRGQARTMQKQMQAEDPLATGLGQVEGGLAAGFAFGAPGGGFVNTAKSLAGYGAAYDLGASEADLTKGEFGQAAIDTGEGAAKGLIVGGAVLGGMKAASALANPTKKILAPLANKIFGFAKSSKRIGPEEMSGIRKYFGMEAPTAKQGAYTPEERLVALEALTKQNGGDTKAALDAMGQRIMAPVNAAKESARKMRATQEGLWRRAIKDFRAAGNNMAAEALEQSGPRAFSHPDVQLPPSVALPEEQFLPRWLEIKQRLAPGGEFAPAGKATASKVEGILSKGRASLDDLLHLKDEINDIQFAPSGDVRMAIPPEVRQGVKELRAMIDDALEASLGADGGEIISHLREYSQFADAFPLDLRTNLDVPGFTPNFGSFTATAGTGTGGALATGLGAAAMIPGMGMAGTMVAGALGSIGAVAIRTATSKPSMYVKMAAYAAKNGSPQIAPFFNEAAQVGLENAMQMWALRFPAAWPALSQALPKVAMEAMKASPEIKAELRRAISEDPTMSDSDKMRALDDINSNRAFQMPNSEEAPPGPPQGLPPQMGPGMLGIP